MGGGRGACGQSRDEAISLWDIVVAVLLGGPLGPAWPVPTVDIAPTAVTPTTHMERYF